MYQADTPPTHSRLSSGQDILGSGDKEFNPSLIVLFNAKDDGSHMLIIQHQHGSRLSKKINLTSLFPEECVWDQVEDQAHTPD